MATILFIIGILFGAFVWGIPAAIIQLFTKGK